MAFKKSSTKIGLIGAKPKINLIKELMEFDEYKSYLGIENFNDLYNNRSEFCL